MITRESPLQEMKTGSIVTVAMRELPALHTTDLRVAPGSSAHTVITRLLCIDLPLTHGQFVEQLASNADKFHILCLAPDWWLIVGYPEVEQKFAALQAENQHHFSAVNVSGQRTTIELEGPKVREVLAHLWDQDLRDKNFPVASVSQGLMAKAPVIVCHTAPLIYRIMVRSSFALHLWKALADAAEELI